MSEVKVNKISPRSGTTVTLGDSGDTIAINSGASLTGFTSTGIDDNATSTAITIDSSENVLVGTTDSNVGDNTGTDTGINLLSSGSLKVANTAANDFNRVNSDGAIINFKKDGTTVGSIGVASGQTALTIGNADTGLSFQGNQNDAIFPYNVSTTALRDNAISLGYSSSRFKDLYLSGDIYLGGTTSANALDDYEEGTWTPTFTASSAPTVSYDEQEGTYTKIGRVVTLTIKLSTTSVSGGSGSLKISGIPFNARGGTSAPYVYGAKPYASDWTGEVPIDVRVIGSLGIFIYRRTTSDGLDSNTSVNDMNTSAGNTLGVTITYETD